MAPPTGRMNVFGFHTALPAQATPHTYIVRSLPFPSTCHFRVSLGRYAGFNALSRTLLVFCALTTAEDQRSNMSRFRCKLS
ncbi:hypothetical protein KOW79_018082 [Hemibagrus wyckioides]|uniref:Uncharacterized protein n=1 Tax=Hemibagrus wyckioides TaxID=337641 RepID=A0A9D3N9X3_9TELE|nr:hypothetical protein KOW79_018082 [Hemibagrus wyckioides]